MGTFTNWNGPGDCCGGGGAKVDVAKLITAFEEMSSGLSSKLDKSEAGETYLKKTDASSTYLAKSEKDILATSSDLEKAKERIGTLEEAGYVTKDNADKYYAAHPGENETYLKTSTAASTYATKPSSS